MDKSMIVAISYGMGTLSGEYAVSFFQDGKIFLGVSCSMLTVIFVSLMVAGVIKLVFTTEK